MFGQTCVLEAQLTSGFKLTECSSVLRSFPSIALRIILRVISARALENGGFFFTTGPRRRGKSSFSRKRLW